MALTLASALLTTSAALGLPLALPWLSLPIHWLLTACLGALPLLIALREPPPRAGHCARDGAVRWSKEGTVLCSSEQWALEFAEVNGGELSPTPRRLPSLSGFALLPLLPCLLAPAVHRVLHPEVRWVNVTQGTLKLSLDGHELAPLDPTASESARAGRWERVPAGRRRLEVRNSAGELVDFGEVTLSPMTEHLGLPANQTHCPWVEITSYGQVGSGTRVETLPAGRQLWALPRPIDHWFSPNPVEDPSARELSGGQVTALRLNPCSEAPPDVRLALEAAGWQ